MAPTMRPNETSFPETWNEVFSSLMEPTVIELREIISARMSQDFLRYPMVSKLSQSLTHAITSWVPIAAMTTSMAMRGISSAAIRELGSGSDTQAPKILLWLETRLDLMLLALRHWPTVRGSRSPLARQALESVPMVKGTMTRSNVTQFPVIFSTVFT